MHGQTTHKEAHLRLYLSFCYCCPILTKTAMCCQAVAKFTHIKFHVHTFSTSQVFTERQADPQIRLCQYMHFFKLLLWKTPTKRNVTHHSYISTASRNNIYTKKSKLLPLLCVMWIICVKKKRILTLVNMARLERCNLYQYANNLHQHSLHFSILNVHSIVCTFLKAYISSPWSLWYHKLGSHY